MNKEQLEEQLIALENRQAEIVSAYIDAVHNWNIEEGRKLEQEWAETCLQIKALNKRLSLLKSAKTIKGRNSNWGHSRADPIYK
ncbi:MAG: hypothetical protein ACLFUH_00910 [Bacteroidales bacterium]